MILHGIKQAVRPTKRVSFLPVIGPQVLPVGIGSVLGMVSDGVEDPVHLGGPSTMVSVIHLLHEIVQGLLLGFVQRQGLADVSDVIKGLQLWHA